MTNILVLEWEPFRLGMRSLPTGALVEVELPSLLGAVRHDLALFGGPRPCVRVPTGTRTPFLVGRSLERAPRVPGEGALSAHGCRAHPDGTLTAIDGNTLWILPRTQAVWVSRVVPPEIVVRDVSLGPDDCLYVCGSRNRRGVVARVEADDISVLEPVLPDDARVQMTARGANEAFWRVDAAAEPFVLVASSAFLLEDNSDFVVMRWGKTWGLRASEYDAVRTWYRTPPNGISIYDVRGRRHTTTDAGSTWTVHDLTPAIRGAWNHLRTGNLLIRAVCPRGDGALLVVASVYDWHAPESRQLLSSAVLSSTDGGRTFAVMATITGFDKEFIDAIWDDG